MANPFKVISNTAGANALASETENPWNALDAGEENDTGNDGNDNSVGDNISNLSDGKVDAEKVDAVIETTNQKVATLVEYMNVFTDAVRQSSGKKDVAAGVLFIVGNEGLPALERLIVAAITKANLPPLPDWVFSIPGGAAGALIDAFIIFGPTRKLPAQARALIIALTAVSWGAAIGGPLLEGWIASKYGKGSGAAKAIEITTKILSASNPRLLLLNSVSTIGSIVADGGFSDEEGAEILHKPQSTGFKDIFNTVTTGGLGLNQGGSIDMRAKFYNCGGRVARQGIYKH